MSKNKIHSINHSFRTHSNKSISTPVHNSFVSIYHMHYFFLGRYVRFFVLAVIVFVVKTFVTIQTSKLEKALVLCFVVRKPSSIFKWFSTETAM